MLILGVDPGYRKLGLALVETDTATVLDTWTVDCGNVYYKQHCFVDRIMRQIHREYGKPALIATENVPNGFAGRGSGGRTACTMHWVLGGIGMWAAQHGVPMRGIPPKSLKTYAAKTIGVHPSEWEGAKGTRAKLKSGIAEAVAKITGQADHKSDHEADAILVAFALAP